MRLSESRVAFALLAVVVKPCVGLEYLGLAIVARAIEAIPCVLSLTDSHLERPIIPCIFPIGCNNHLRERFSDCISVVSEWANAIHLTFKSVYVSDSACHIGFESPSMIFAIRVLASATINASTLNLVVCIVAFKATVLDDHSLSASWAVNCGFFLVGHDVATPIPLMKPLTLFPFRGIIVPFLPLAA